MLMGDGQGLGVEGAWGARNMNNLKLHLMTTSNEIRPRKEAEVPSIVIHIFIWEKH